MLTVAICYSMAHFFAFSTIYCPVLHSELFLCCGLKLHGWSLCQFNSVSIDKIKVTSGISVFKWQYVTLIQIIHSETADLIYLKIKCVLLWNVNAIFSHVKIISPLWKRITLMLKELTYYGNNTLKEYTSMWTETGDLITSGLQLN